MCIHNMVILGKTVAELLDSLSGRTRFKHFVQYLIAFYSGPEVASVVISRRFVKMIVPDKFVKCGDSREILPGAIGGGIFDSFFPCNFRPEVVIDVIAGVAV